jgi:hypothetical protein
MNGINQINKQKGFRLLSHRSFVERLVVWKG